MNKVAIYGGLGNQMFQYALCVALNHRGVKSRISLLDFLYSIHHQGFNLTHAFRIKLPLQLQLLACFLQNCKFIYKNKIAGFFLKRLIPKYHTFRYNFYKEEREFEFDNNVFNQQSSFIFGIWQVESYFLNLRSVILKEFTFRVPDDSQNKAIIERINSSNSVSIHVRRGDYLFERWNNILYVIKGADYYANSVNYLNEKIENPLYFIFSDDFTWVEENLRIANSICINNNSGISAYIDMYLMSLCKHNIIANSTFSWWGAWLNKNENKMVLMPDRWINGKTCEGIFPSQWIKIKVD